MITKKIFIGSNDVDSNFELKMSSFFKMMQDIAVEHSEILGVGHAQTIEKGLMWVITRFNLEITKMPSYRQNVILKTYPGKTNKFIFPRHFILTDEDGNVLIRAVSIWLVLNQETRKVCLNPFENNDLPYEVVEGELESPQKINTQAIYYKETRKVRYNDIDLNGHLNNTKYIDYIFDLHDSNFYKEHTPTSLLINYNHELKDGDEVKLYSSNSNPEYITGILDQTNIFDVILTFKNR